MYVAAYWEPANAGIVLVAPRRLPEVLRSRGWGDTGMSARYSEIAAKRAAAVLRRGWRAAIAAARQAISRNAALSDDERHWLRLVLARPSLTAMCLRAEAIDAGPEWNAKVDQVQLGRSLRTLLLSHRPGRPRRARHAWLELDGSMYRVFSRPEDRHFRGAWIAIAGIRPGHRICIPLAGSGFDEFRPHLTGHSGHRPDIRVDVRTDRLIFDVMHYVEGQHPTGDLTAGIDKGYRTLLTMSCGDPADVREYGKDASSSIRAEADALTERLRERRRVQAYERSIRNAEPKKARRVRRCSLGHKKRDELVRRSRGRLRSDIDRALNEMFRANKDLRRLNVERLDFLGRKLARATNRRLGRWLKGYLQQRLAYKAELNGVELNVVNAAWTSLTCPRCWFPSKKNRHAERFVCRSCGYTGSSDAIAATNVLTRGSDPAITRWTSPDEVKLILEERWRAALNGSAWGLRESGDGPSRQAANNCGLDGEDRSPSLSSADALTGTLDVATPR